MNYLLYATLLAILRMQRIQRAETLAAELVTALDALPDDAMRQARLAKWLVPLEDELVVEMLEQLVCGAQTDRARYRAVMSSILDLGPLLAQVGETRAEAWRACSRRQRRNGALTLLTTAPPRKQYYAAHQLDVNEQMDSTPLGWRKSLARRFDRQVLDRLVYDKHPAVVRILLDNPRLLERDVVKMAAMQPSTEKTLHAIFTHPRWMRRYSVKKALVFNPYSSQTIALGLLGFLHEQDLQQATMTLKLHQEVRNRARLLLEARQARRHSATHRSRKMEPAQSPTDAPPPVTQEHLALEFLASLPDVDLTLHSLDELRLVTPRLPLEDPVPVDEETIALDVDDFLNQLPADLMLVPLDPDEEL